VPRLEVYWREDIGDYVMCPMLHAPIPMTRCYRCRYYGRLEWPYFYCLFGERVTPPAPRGELIVACNDMAVVRWGNEFYFLKISPTRDRDPKRWAEAIRRALEDYLWCRQNGFKLSRERAKTYLKARERIEKRERYLECLKELEKQWRVRIFGGRPLG